MFNVHSNHIKWNCYRWWRFNSLNKTMNQNTNVYSKPTKKKWKMAQKKCFDIEWMESKRFGTTTTEIRSGDNKNETHKFTLRKKNEWWQNSKTEIYMMKHETLSAEKNWQSRCASFRTLFIFWVVSGRAVYRKVCIKGKWSHMHANALNIEQTHTHTHKDYWKKRKQMYSILTKGGATTMLMISK